MHRRAAGSVKFSGTGTGAPECVGDPPILPDFASQPTRGLDVGSIEFIHKQIVAQRDEGVAVLLVSAELDEVLALSDTIGVMYKGKLVATMPRSEATREKVGLLMTGGSAEENAPAH